VPRNPQAADELMGCVRALLRRAGSWVARSS